MDKKKTVALYGGSFDPPHIGHVAIIQALAKLAFIDKVIVMPTFLNPFKEEFTAPADCRLQWLQEIFAPYKNIQISDFEVKKKRKVPTIETIKALQEEYEKIYLVIGADNLASLDKWYKFNELSKLVTFIVVTRDNIEVPHNFQTLNIDIDVSSSDLRKDLDISKLPKPCATKIAHYYKEYNAKKN